MFTILSLTHYILAGLLHKLPYIQKNSKQMRPVLTATLFGARRAFLIETGCIGNEM